LPDPAYVQFWAMAMLHFMGCSVNIWLGLWGIAQDTPCIFAGSGKHPAAIVYRGH
jgi:hypothetical protein